MPLLNASYLDRLLALFARASNVSYDNTESGLDATDVQAAIDEVAELAETGGFGSIAANTVIANTTTSSAAPVASAPQGLIFSNTTSGAGNIRMQVAPVGYVAVSVASAANQNCDYDPGENGRFTFLIKLSLKNTGSNFAKLYEVEAVRASGTMTLIGSAVASSSGDMTGITVTISASSGSIRVNIAHSTGSTVTGRAHFSAAIEDALA